MRDDVIWCAAAPLWGATASEAFEQPEILRFAGDDFMDQLEATLADDPRTLSSFVATSETWRDAVGAAPAANGTDSGVTKLYQPSHGRFYLVAASLVCSRHWLPDKKVDTTKGESTFFVLRKLRAADPAVAIDAADPSTYAECAWVEGDAPHWDDVPGTGLADGERRLPMFPLTYHDERSDRRLFAGLVPVSGREALAAAAPVLPTDPTAADPMAPLTDVRLGPLVAVIEGLHALLGAFGSPFPPTNADAQASLYFALLDLADWLEDNVPAVWAGSGGLPAAQQTLLDRLVAPNGFRLGQTWHDALTTAHAAGPEAARTGPPAPVQGMDAVLPLTNPIADAIAALGVEDGTTDPARTTFFTEARAALLEASPAAAAAAATPAPAATAPAPSATTAADEGIYVLRCAYERPQCRESHRVRLSGASRPVTLAHFYDPDAPFRPARIPTPLDTSLEGLRKFPKNVSVSISKSLRAQIDRMQGAKLSDLEDGSIGSGGGVSLGMICQLSIPIITICALILLMIIVSLLNIVFWWIPLFKICLPTVEAE